MGELGKNVLGQRESREIGFGLRSHPPRGGESDQPRPEHRRTGHAGRARATSLEAAVIYRVASRLGDTTISIEQIRRTYTDIVADDASIGAAFEADILAFLDRDPAASA